MKSAQGTSSTPTPKTRPDLPFGELLVSRGLLSREELIKALNEQREQGGRLGEVLLRLKMLSDEDVTLALAEHLSMEYIRLDDITRIDVNTRSNVYLRLSPNDFALWPLVR